MAQFTETSLVASPEPMHFCCDVCAKDCECKACNLDEDFTLSKEAEAFEQFGDKPECSHSVQQCQQLNAQLLELRSDIVTKDPAAALVGVVWFDKCNY